MSLAEFNGAVLAGHADAEALLPEWERAYERAVHRAGREAAAAFRAQTAAAWQPPSEGNLIDFATIADAVAPALGRLRRRTLREVTGQPLARIGVSWSIKQPLLAALLDLAGQRTGAKLGAAVQPVLRETIAEAYEAGLSVPQTAALIRERIDDAAPAQAQMLARTDLNGLANGGSVAAAQLAGMPYKQWLTAHDEKVRKMHVEADGQIVPVEQPFDVCGEQLAFPGDPAGSDSCTCNCRCTVIYLDDAQVAASAAEPNGGSMYEGLGEAIATASSNFRVTAATIAPPQVRWVSDIAFEGTATDDGRFILPGALDWRDLPLTLMAMTETSEGGHIGAFVAGRIDQIRRDRKRDMNGEPLADGVTAFRASGVFDVEGENGSEVARLVDDETVRGVSIDMAVAETVLRDPETGQTIKPGTETEDDVARLFAGELQFAVKRGTIMAATVCPTPAFANARIAVTASGERVLRLTVPFRIEAEVVTASAAGLAPVAPPRDWFFEPEGKHGMPLTVTDDGQVFGHIALWDSCHTGKQGVCFQPPSSPSGYAYFNLGEVVCDDGSRVACGQITMGTDHAPLSANWKQTKAHYENTGVVAADVRATDGRFGIWVAGAVRPKITAEQARELRAAKPSGDWRQITPNGPLELIGALEVNVPGYPVPRPEVRLVASVLYPDGEPVALVAAGAEVDEDEFDRKLAVLAARAEGGIDALAELAGV